MSISSVNSNNKRPGEELENPAKFAKTEEKAAFYAKEAEKTQDLAKRIEFHKNAVIYDPTNEGYCSKLKADFISEMKEKIKKASNFWDKLNDAIKIFALDPHDREFFQHTTFEPLTQSTESIENRLAYQHEHMLLCSCGDPDVTFFKADEKMSLEQRRRFQYFYDVNMRSFHEKRALEELEAASIIEDKMHWALLSALNNPKNFRTVALPKLLDFYYKEHEEGRLDQNGLKKEIVEWLQVLPSSEAQDKLSQINSDLEIKYLKPIQHYFRNEIDASERSAIWVGKGMEAKDFLLLCKGTFALMPDKKNYSNVLPHYANLISTALFSSYKKTPLEKTELQLISLRTVASSNAAINTMSKNALQNRLEDLVKNGSKQQKHGALLNLSLLRDKRTNEIAHSFASLEAKNDREKSLNLFHAAQCDEEYHKLFEQCVYQSAIDKEISADVLYAHLLFPSQESAQKLLVFREKLESLENKNFTKWDRIPKELFLNLFNFLSMKDIGRLMRVSKFFKELIISKTFAESWKRAFLQDFPFLSKYGEIMNNFIPDPSTDETKYRASADMDYRLSNDKPVYREQLPRLCHLSLDPAVLISVDSNTLILRNLESGVRSEFSLSEFIEEGLNLYTNYLGSWKNQTALLKFSVSSEKRNQDTPKCLRWALCLDLKNSCILTKKSLTLDSIFAKSSQDDSELIIVTRTKNGAGIKLEIYDPLTEKSENVTTLTYGKTAASDNFCVNQDWVCLTIGSSSHKKLNLILVINRKTKEIREIELDKSITLPSLVLRGNFLYARTRLKGDVTSKCKNTLYDLIERTEGESYIWPCGSEPLLSPVQIKWKIAHAKLNPKMVGSHVLISNIPNGNYSPQYLSFSAFDAPKVIQTKK